jgi:uncharacterized protein (DUF983 family)
MLCKECGMNMRGSRPDRKYSAVVWLVLCPVVVVALCELAGMRVVKFAASGDGGAFIALSFEIVVGVIAGGIIGRFSRRNSEPE